ncbi:hypothetical protein EV182_008592, partial [Spiromyces aspiralis]
MISNIINLLQKNSSEPKRLTQRKGTRQSGSGWTAVGEVMQRLASNGKIKIDKTQYAFLDWLRLKHLSPWFELKPTRQQQPSSVPAAEKGLRMQAIKANTPPALLRKEAESWQVQYTGQPFDINSIERGIIPASWSNWRKNAQERR